MAGLVLRSIVCAAVGLGLAGCNSIGLGGGGDKSGTEIGVAGQPAAGQAADGSTVAPPSKGPVYVSGKCPQVVVRDGSEAYRVYAKGATDDPTQLLYQAALADSTRQCSVDGSNLKVAVVVQGRLIAGPAGSSGTVTLPIRVTVKDGDTSLYDHVTNYPATIPPGQTTTQFLFTDNNVSISGGSGGFTTVFVSFDKPAPATPAKHTTTRRKK